MKARMQLTTGTTLAILAVVAAAATLQAQDPLTAMANPAADYVPGELLVRFVENTTPATIAQMRQAMGVHHLREFPGLRLAHWRLPPGLNVEQAQQVLSTPGFRQFIESAEPNWIIRVNQNPTPVFPLDPRRGDLWGLHNAGQTGGTRYADIDAPEAWAVRTDASSVVVGVIDSGIDYNHPDLAANIWTNLTELNGVAGQDDDGNGFVDDIHGWDFVNADNDPMDDYGHGTHVAGTIGAAGNNGIGVTGVCWNVRLMPLKFLNSSGNGTTANAIAAVQYAASFMSGGSHVVRITNNSWGGGTRSTALEAAITASGALFVAAAGNSGSSKKQYPAGSDTAAILSVAATDANDARASFSNYGSTWVDLAAPGVGILSTYRGGYDLMDGTSMATPHVAGVAALVLAEHSTLNTAALKAAILNAVDPVPSLQGVVLTGGRLNAYRALTGAAPPVNSDSLAPSAVSNLVGTTPSFNSVTLTWTAPGDDGGSGTAYAYDVRYLENEVLTATSWDYAYSAIGEPLPVSAGLSQTFTVTGLYAEMDYYLAVKTIDENGNVSGISNVVQVRTPSAVNPAYTVDTIQLVSGVFDRVRHALGPGGQVGMAYWASSELRFALQTGSGWALSTVASSATGAEVDFAPNGNPRVSFSSGGVRFAELSNSAWVVQMVESNQNNDQTGLGHDASGNPTVSYRRASGQGKGLRFARRQGSTWTSQLVDGTVARWNTLAYGPDGNPAIAYSVDADGDGWLDTLRFARLVGSSWQIQNVESGVQGYGVLPSLAFKPGTDYRPGIVHNVSGVVRCAEWNGSAWVASVVAAGREGTIAYDSSGTPYVAYEADGVMTVARREGLSWVPELVDEGGGGNIELLGNQVTVSYQGWSGYDSATKFGRRSTASWPAP